MTYEANRYGPTCDSDNGITRPDQGGNGGTPDTVGTYDITDVDESSRATKRTSLPATRTLTETY